MTRRRELWFLGPGQVAIQEGATPPSLANGQLRARAIASGVSQGTELLLFRGEGPQPFDPSLDPPGAPTYPRRYGYAWVGRVDETRTDSVPAGAHVFALAPHGDEHVLSASSVRVVPADLPAARVTLAANLETAVTVIWDSGVSLGDEVVVLGGGMVGLLCGWLARRAGARRVRLLEPSLRRREAARALGIDTALAPDDDEPRADADVVIEASGHPECLDRAIAHAARDATITIASFYGQRTAPVALGSNFHRQRLGLKASQVSNLPPSKMARWTFDRRFALVRELLAEPRLDALLDPPVPFGAAAETYQRAAAAPGASLQIVFSYDDA